MAGKSSIEITKPSLSMEGKRIHANAGGLKGEGIGGIVAVVVIVALVCIVFLALILQ